ncbi:MAG: AAA family ATPase [Nitrospirota bacterium]
MSILDHIKAARRVSVPLVALTTADQYGAINALSELLSNGKALPVIRWDLIHGLRGLNPRGGEAITQMIGDMDPQATTDPVMALAVLEKLPRGGACLVLNAHRILDNPAVAQAVGNLRDVFKSNNRMLILLAPSITLPAELRHDVLILDEPYPNPQELQAMLEEQYRAAEVTIPEDQRISREVDAVRGLPLFAAEQAIALSMRRDGISLDQLWQRKVSMIEQVPGLTVWKGQESFAQIGGLSALKSYLLKILTGKIRYRAIVFMDEIEKMLAGAMGAVQDSSGTSQAIHGKLLSYMQDKKATGLLLVGHPGTCKSQIAKAAGHEVGIPVLAWDTGSTKSSLVGESERNTDMVLKVISAVSDDAALFIATSNKCQQLPPELRRRFKLGTVMFDFPDDAEKAAIWKIYRKQYEIPRDCPQPDDTNWTGAEIEQCCQRAWQLEMPLTEAARYLVPTCKAAPDAVEELRRQAAGRYLSASYPGVYQLPTAKAEIPAKPKRAMAL